MLVGVIAFNVLKVMDPADDRAVGVLFVGYFFQGLGFFVTMFYICIYMIRCVVSPAHRLRGYSHYDVLPRIMTVTANKVLYTLSG